MKKNIIVIAGPTASGKSQMAIDLALRYNGEIINCDSQQLYKDTPIISACPDEKDKLKVCHHLYQVYEGSKQGNVVDWLNLCVDKITNIWQKNKTPVVVGGSGLYINNLIYGTTPIPAISDEVRKKVEKIENCYDHLDELAQKALNRNDITRTKRALEVLLETNKSIIEWHEVALKKAIEANFFVIKIMPPKKELDSRISKRFDAMIGSGAIEEAIKFKELNINPNMPAAKALGLPEIMGFLDGKTSLEEAISLAKIHSNQYAKRQLTWFKNKLEANFVLDNCYTSLDKSLCDLIDRSF